MLLAGPVAERLSPERDDLGLIVLNLVDGKGAEFEGERFFASHRDPDGRQALVQEFLRNAGQTVRPLLAHPTLNGAVVGLADELLYHETLSREAAKAIIEDILGRDEGLGEAGATDRRRLAVRWVPAGVKSLLRAPQWHRVRHEFRASSFMAQAAAPPGMPP